MKVAMPLKIKNRQEVFTHKLDGVFRHFPIGTMRDIAETYANMCDEIIACTSPIASYAAEHIRKNMGIEQVRLDRLKEPYLSQPIIAIQWEDDKKVTIIDGNHRYLKLHDAGKKTIRCYVFKQAAWEQLLIPLSDSDERLQGNSGVIEQEQQMEAEYANQPG